MLLYELGRSRSMRGHWILREAGVSYETKKIDLKNGEGQSEEYLKIQPFGKVPALKDGDFVVYESSAIINYISEKVPDQRLIPSSATQERALYDQWMSVCIHELESPLWMATKSDWYYPKDLNLSDTAKACKIDGVKTLKVLERHLADNHYFLGNQFTGVDVMYGHVIDWARGYGWCEGLSACLDYVSRVRERESFPSFLYS